MSRKPSKDVLTLFYGLSLMFIIAIVMTSISVVLYNIWIGFIVGSIAFSFIMFLLCGALVVDRLDAIYDRLEKK